MSQLSHYHFLNHIDAPKRYLSLTLDELIIASLFFVLFICSSQKIIVSLFGMGLVSLLRMLKKGDGPQRLPVMAYWYLPSSITGFFLPSLPKSYQRIWKA